MLVAACDKKQADEQAGTSQAATVSPANTMNKPEDHDKAGSADADATQMLEPENPDKLEAQLTEEERAEQARILKEEEAFENRKIYSELDANIIKGIKDDLLEQAIVDYVLLKIDAHPEKIYEVVTALPEGFVTVFATWEVEAEVNNGGFEQYFSNTSGDFALEAIEGFDKIGAKQFANITKQALDLSLKQMAKMAEPGEQAGSTPDSEENPAVTMEKLDNQFFDNEENISELRVKYIREHPALFDEKTRDSASAKKAAQ